MRTSAIGRCEQRPETAELAAARDEAHTGEHYLPALTEQALRERVRQLQGRIDELEQALLRERAGRLHATRDLERFCKQLSALAHELRNPLSSISGWLQLICAGKIEFETRRRALASMTRSLRSLTRTVEDFADYARCIDGSLALHRVPVSPAVLLAQALRECRALAVQRGISLECDVAPDLPELSADPCRLRQVFELLISSVLRAAPRGGEVEVRVRSDGAGLRVHVGESEHTRIDHPELGPLAPEDDSRRAQPPALSLQLARQLIELHHGSIVSLGDAFELQLSAASVQA